MYAAVKGGQPGAARTEGSQLADPELGTTFQVNCSFVAVTSPTPAALSDVCL